MRNDEKNTYSDDGKVFCQQCGAKIDENDVHCPNCGAFQGERYVEMPDDPADAPVYKKKRRQHSVDYWNYIDQSADCGRWRLSALQSGVCAIEGSLQRFGRA